jgi:hypothetical protein
MEPSIKTGVFNDENVILCDRVSAEGDVAAHIAVANTGAGGEENFIAPDHVYCGRGHIESMDSDLDHRIKRREWPR